MIITIVTLFITLVTKSHDPSSRVVGLLTFKVFFFRGFWSVQEDVEVSLGLYAMLKAASLFVEDLRPRMHEIQSLMPARPLNNPTPKTLKAAVSPKTPKP